MKWYNPLSWNWFKKTSPDDSIKKGELEELILYCANPQCQQPITEDRIPYNPAFNEMYHDSECANFAAAHRVMQTGEFLITNLVYLSREEILKEYLKQNQKKQKGTLSLGEQVGVLSEEKKK